MRSYVYIVIAILFALILSLNRIEIFSLDEMSLFLTVIGLIYGLIAAFSINNAWERFSKIRDAVAMEIDSLDSLNTLFSQISDKAKARKLKSVLLEYCKEVPKVEWHKYWEAESVHQKFREIQKIVSETKIRTQKDLLLLDKAMDEMREAASARSQELILAQSRISKVQWLLNIFLSVILILGLVFLRIPNYNLSVFVVATMIAAILLILVVVYDLDSMKVAEEEVSVEPYLKLVRLLDPKSRISSRDILGK